jgi:hypothetical protein
VETDTRWLIATFSPLAYARVNAVDELVIYVQGVDWMGEVDAKWLVIYVGHLWRMIAWCLWRGPAHR